MVIVQGSAGTSTSSDTGVNEFTVVAEIVAAGGGIALLPRWTTHRHPDVVLRPLTGVNSVRRIDILARPETLKRRSVMTVCETLQAVMIDLAAGTRR